MKAHHACVKTDLPAIHRDGLQPLHAGRHGRVLHEGVYFSRAPRTTNLPRDLYTRGPIWVIEVDLSDLAPLRFYPDDSFYRTRKDLVPAQVMKALDCTPREAQEIISLVRETPLSELIDILQPFWEWYWNHVRGGSLCYCGPISPDRFVQVQPYVEDFRIELNRICT